MRVFVTGTGRCGTVTFASACQYIDGFTAKHESLRGGRMLEPEYPDNHIEVDPHLVWIMPELKRKYPDAYWVCLTRDRQDLVDSLAKRATLMKWGELAFNGGLNSKQTAEKFVDFIWYVLQDVDLYLHTPVPSEDFVKFVGRIGGTYKPKALEVLKQVHNAS